MREGYEAGYEEAWEEDAPTWVDDPKDVDPRETTEHLESEYSEEPLNGEQQAYAQGFTLGHEQGDEDAWNDPDGEDGDYDEWDAGSYEDDNEASKGAD